MMRIAIIGAGSIGFTRTLVHDILAVPDFADTFFSFTDISARNLEMVTKLLKRDIKANCLPARIEATTNRRRALKDADFVVNTSRIGGLEAFETDIEIPLKYGVDQCVGDTLCAGGIMYGQRNVPAILDFCRDIREVARPGAMLLNYANPNAINTWAANVFGEVPTIGLCHGVHGGHWQIAQVIELLLNPNRNPGDKGYIVVPQSDVHIVCAGINHQTWYVKVQYRGEDWTGRLLKGFENHPVFSKTEKVRIDILRRFGFYSTESNGHLSEYLPWYRKRTGEIKRWIDLSEWINGETGGYLRVCRESRNWFETDYPVLLEEDPPEIGPQRRSHEHCSWLLEGLVTGRVYRGHFNVQNRGTITNLPNDAIVEVPGYADLNGLNIPRVGDLPMGCAAVCGASINVQRLAVHAAVHGDVELLKQSMMMDPLVGAVCNPPEISQMVDEMLVAQQQWLPQYAPAIPAAQKRLDTDKALGKKSTRGAARLKIRDVKELQKDRDTMAAADKAEAQRRRKVASANHKRKAKP